MLLTLDCWIALSSWCSSFPVPIPSCFWTSNNRPGNTSESAKRSRSTELALYRLRLEILAQPFEVLQGEGEGEEGQGEGREEVRQGSSWEP